MYYIKTVVIFHDTTVTNAIGNNGSKSVGNHSGNILKWWRWGERKPVYVILFFGPCIFNNEDKNKPTKCTN